MANKGSWEKLAKEVGNGVVKEGQKIVKETGRGVAEEGKSIVEGTISGLIDAFNPFK